jgi:sugar diacid utilization regulator
VGQSGHPGTAYCAAATARTPEPFVPRGVPHWVEDRGDTAVVVAEAGKAAELEAALPARPGPVALGAVRLGWEGAQESVEDALQVLALARPGVTRFEDAWVDATLVAGRDRLAVVTEEVRGLAQRSSHLAEAVVAFAEEGLSVVSGARALHIHPNTMIYRLERWKSLTGWDARTFDGLQRSLACLRMGG